MIAVIQRTKRASVSIDGEVSGVIGMGLLILLGIEDADDKADIEWLSKKVMQLRIFNDDEGIMNRSVQDVDGEVLVVSQFTLHASTKKGNRPSYIKAARPETAIPLYESFVAACQEYSLKTVQTGEFGADMKVELVNDGPVTIIIDTKDRK
jgi:D-tyrosyl-tRNA(Tyr) deacylase